jgi:hypothetical protein
LTQILYLALGLAGFGLLLLLTRALSRGQAE